MNSRIFYRGPSELDGGPIIGVITGLTTASVNPKTGNMLQTYILREDVPPPAAIEAGTDASICGDCKLRGVLGKGRACYVQTKWAPLGVWKVVQPQLATWYDNLGAELQILNSSEGRFIRMGTYGDPAAIPLRVWEWLLSTTAGHTGYTHQWRNPKFAAFKALCMASVDSPQEYLEAMLDGWRTFRVRASTRHGSFPAEITCPASAEAGHRTTCEACGICAGHAGKGDKNILIVAHGQGAGYAFQSTLPL